MIFLLLFFHLFSYSEEIDFFKIRDPFKPALILNNALLPKSEIESFALGELNLLGIITGPDRMKALIQAPNGKTYFLSEKDKIGSQGGVVQRISEKSIFIQEKILNLLGKQEPILTEMKISEGDL